MSKSSEIIKRDDIRGICPDQLDGNAARAIGRAVCELLKTRGAASPRIAVGHDCRRGNIEISNGFMLGFMEAGGSCRDLGMVSTEHVYYACSRHADEYSAGAMVTASHNPGQYNGIKMLYSGCAPFSSDDLAFIGKRVDGILALGMGGMDFGEYATRMMGLSGLDEAPSGRRLSVVVLAGNGMGAVAFEPLARLLEPKGLHCKILEGEPDGSFPNGVPNPLLPSFMQRLSRKVLEHGADLGIGFDGDADRAGFVDGSGNEIIPSHVLALIAMAKLKRSGVPRPVVMRNLCCSRLLEELFSGGSAELIDTPVGHGRIKQLMRCPEYIGRTVFAGEHSGHYFYPEFDNVDSGVLTSLNMISIFMEMKAEGRSPEERLAQWRRRYRWSGEINYELPSMQDALQAISRVWETHGRGGRRMEVRTDGICKAQRVFPAEGAYDPSSMEVPDLKVCQGDGSAGSWFVLRPSGNEPKLRLNVEAWGEDPASACSRIADGIEATLIECGAARK